MPGWLVETFRVLVLVGLAAGLGRAALAPARDVRGRDDLLADVPGRFPAVGTGLRLLHLEVRQDGLEVVHGDTSYLFLPTGVRPLRWTWPGRGARLGLALGGRDPLARQVFVTTTSAQQLTELLRSLGWQVGDPHVRVERVARVVVALLLLLVVGRLVLLF